MFIVDFRNTNVSEYRFSIMGNSNVDVVNFYSRFTQYAQDTSIYLKIRSHNDDYVDKIAIASENVSVDNDALVVKWTMGAVSTHCKKIDLQLQFEKEGEIINQTGIVTLTLANTIDVEGLIPPIYPQVLKQLQEQIDTLKADSYAVAEMSYANDNLQIVLKNKDNQTLTSLQVSIPTSDKYTKTEADQKFLAMFTAHNKVYGTDNDGNQVGYDLDYGTGYSGNVARRDSNNQLHVPQTPTAQDHATSKYYVDTLIDEIEQRSDVVDVVGTYADLEAYDTSHLAPNSLIKVINDETHDNEITYYRWVVSGATGTWTYVASEGAYYTTTQIDQMLTGYYLKNAHLIPTADNTYDIGSSTYAFKDGYFGGKIYVDTINGKNFSSYGIGIGNGWVAIIGNLLPNTNNLRDLGSASNKWKDAYINGNIFVGGIIYGATYNESFDAVYTTINNLTEANANAEIKWSKMLQFSKSADTTFTFETAKTNCLNEYKAIITNSGANPIALTFTGVNHILCNDDNIAVVNNVMTIPSGVSVEINVLNNKMIAVNFSAQ